MLSIRNLISRDLTDITHIGTSAADTAVSLSGYFSWLRNFSFFNYALEALLINETSELMFQQVEMKQKIIISGSLFLKYLGFGHEERVMWLDLAKLGVMFVVFLTIVFVWLQFFVRERR